MFGKHWVIFFVLFVLISGGLSAEGLSVDWPEFRGPGGQGIADRADPAIEWSQKKNIVWKKPISGGGWSSPVVYQGAVYVTTALEDDDGNPNSLRVLRLDAKTGDVVWDREAIARTGPTVRQGKNSHASPTPIIEDGKIYAHFGHMGTVCLDLDGNVVWWQTKVNYEPKHGNGGSPILVDDKLIFNCDGETDPFIVALNKLTGDVVWNVKRKKTSAKNKFSFSTPLLIEENGRRVFVSPGSGAVAAHDPADGKEIWRVDYGSGFSVTPRPVYGHGMVFISSGFAKSRVMAIRLGGSGDITDTHVAWKTDSGVPRTPSMLLVGENLYFVSDKGLASCVDALTGKLHWAEEINGAVSASPVYAAGRIYITTEKGKTVVIEAGRKFKKLAENDLKERTLASAAVSGGTMFIRTVSNLYCIRSAK